MVITFTNKATDELRERLSNDLPQSIIDKMHISTIHSFCRTFLRDNANEEIKILNTDQKRMFIKSHFKEKFSGKSYIPQSEYYKVFQTFDESSRFMCKYDEWIEDIKVKFFDETDLLKDSEYINFLEENGLNEENFIFPVSKVKSKYKYAGRWYANKYLAVAEATKEYQILLSEYGLYDFERLQIKAAEYMHKNKDKLKIKYKNIFIDEFQDIDSAQLLIFDYLIENSNYFTIVGDIKQSIYSFKGSSFTFFKNFIEKHAFDSVYLKMNYRSARKIVDFNNKFFKVSDEKLQIPFRKFDGGAYYIENNNFSEQAKEIVKIVTYLNKVKGIKYSDMALLFRSLSPEKVVDLIKELLSEGINFTMNRNFFNDSGSYPEFRLILLLFNYILGYCDDFSLNDFFFK